MRESVTQQRRVGEDGLRVVNPFQLGRSSAGEQPAGVTVPSEEAPANYVPAAAGIRRGQAWSESMGVKRVFAAQLGPLEKPGLNPGEAVDTAGLESGRGEW